MTVSGGAGSLSGILQNPNLVQKSRALLFVVAISQCTPVQSSAFSAERTQANKRLPRPRFCQEGTKDDEKKKIENYQTTTGGIHINNRLSTSDELKCVSMLMIGSLVYECFNLQTLKRYIVMPILCLGCVHLPTPSPPPQERLEMDSPIENEWSPRIRKYKVQLADKV